MTDIFPIIQPAARPQPEQSLPLYQEVAWDFNTGQPIFDAGAPRYVTGLAAVKTWIYKALMTDRRRYAIYSWNAGNELDALIGQNFTAQTKEAEATRYVREALEGNPYITGVPAVAVSFASDTLTISATVDTIYGQVIIDV